MAGPPPRSHAMRSAAVAATTASRRIIRTAPTLSAALSAAGRIFDANRQAADIRAGGPPPANPRQVPVSAATPAGAVGLGIGRAAMQAPEEPTCLSGRG